MSISALAPLPAAQWNSSTAAHLIYRAGFGAPPAEVDRLVSMKLEDAVRQLLDFNARPEPFELPSWAGPDPTRGEKLQAARQASEEEKKKLRKEMMADSRQRLVEFGHTWLRRMHQTGAPLQEKLTLFWHGHFATSAQKVRDAALLCRQNDLFRRHAAGHWPTFLENISADPAMMLYLDQAESRPKNPNENYARELMELFTLGEGNYSETDVREAARALTGLAYDRLTQTAVHRPRLRDATSKSLFGQRGDFNDKDLVRIITQQPAAARFITSKLWYFFTDTEAPPVLANAMADEFRAGGLQFKPFLQTLLQSQAFYAPELRRKQIKSPVQLLVSVCRELERDLPAAPICHFQLRALGQELFHPPNVKGWDGGIAWINTTTLTQRHQLVEFLVTGAMNNVPRSPNRPNRPNKDPRRQRAQLAQRNAIPMSPIFNDKSRQSPELLLAEMERRFFHSPIESKTRAGLVEFIKDKKSLDDSDLRELVQRALCTPDFQLC